MITLIYLAIGFVIGYIIGKRRPKSGLEMEQAQEKKRNFQKVMEYFDEHKIATNDDIQALLGVSDATAERYLQEMETWGKIRQVGRTGKQVTYEKI